ncbi:MAG: TRAP transporter fused permease subunit [Dehalococcoidales bacterium]|nr:TRAP transporter fused permease subunit [Dehalococcoidales bacterium]
MKNRQSRAITLAISLVSLAMALFLASYGFFLWASDLKLITIFVPACLVLWGLIGIKDGTILQGNRSINRGLGALIILTACVIGAYFFINFGTLIGVRLGNNIFVDLLLGGLGIVLVVLATWKTTGRAIPITLFVFLIYAYTAFHFPGILKAPSLSFVRLLQLGATSLNGIFGLFPETGFSMVVIFLYFAGILQAFGGLNFVMNICIRLFKNIPWGLPQIPVIASMLFGTFSGSAAANVAGTGCFTIPMMKKFGVPPQVAGAIEAVASTGGQVMPPVLGIAAFVMASLLNISYGRIVVISFAPAVLFYVITGFSVYLTTLNTPIANLPPEMRKQLDTGKDMRTILIDGLPMGIGLTCLIVLLVSFGLSVMISGLYTVVLLIVVQLVLNLIRGKFSRSVWPQYGHSLMEGIRNGSSQTMSLILMMATMGIVADLIVATGISQKLSFMMVDLAGNNLIILIILTYVVCLLFGLATTTLVSYLLVVLLAAPALLSFGIPLIITHFVVFYAAIISAITPPVAVAVAVGATIAKASYFKTAVQAMKIGIALFLMPFIFFSRPAILDAKLSTTPLAFVELAIGLLALAYGLSSTSKQLTGYSRRIVLGLLGVFSLLPLPAVIRWASLVAILVIAAIIFTLRKRASVVSAQRQEVRS